MIPNLCRISDLFLDRLDFLLRINDLRPSDDPGELVVELHGFLKKILRWIPEIGRLPSPAIKDDLQESLQEFSLRGALPDSTQKSVEGIDNHLLWSHDNFKVRAITEINGRCFVDGGHETVNRLHLEFGVVSQDLIDRSSSLGWEVFLFQRNYFG